MQCPVAQLIACQPVSAIITTLFCGEGGLIERFNYGCDFSAKARRHLNALQTTEFFLFFFASDASRKARAEVSNVTLGGNGTCTDHASALTLGDYLNHHIISSTLLLFTHTNIPTEHSGSPTILKAAHAMSDKYLTDTGRFSS